EGVIPRVGAPEGGLSNGGGGGGRDAGDDRGARRAELRGDERLALTENRPPHPRRRSPAVQAPPQTVPRHQIAGAEEPAEPLPEARLTGERHERQRPADQ